MEGINSKTTTTFQPTLLNERVTTLDTIRGFCLLGILLVNIFTFYLPLPYIDLGNWFTDAIDIIWHQELDVFVQSSFYPMFSMLFGYGIAMQYEKAQRLGTNFYNFGLRRLGVLFVVGIIHAVFIWWGDILVTYAICGLFLLIFLRFNSWILVTFSVVINFLYLIFILGLMFLISMANIPYDEFVDLSSMEEAITAYGIGSWSDAFIQRLTDLKYQLSNTIISSLFTILPYMLLGAAASKWNLIERAKKLKGIWIILALLGVILGLLIKNIPYMFDRTVFLDAVKVYIGGPILSIGYIAVIVLICLIPFANKVLKPIASAGRMALTLYIMQSIICSIIFYNFGFGLYGEVDVRTATFIAIAIFVVQVLFAELWFIKFKQGPLEMLTKKVVYGLKK